MAHHVAARPLWCIQVSFESVVEAIRDKAFVSSSLPVSLSLEMYHKVRKLQWLAG